MLLPMLLFQHQSVLSFVYDEVWFISLQLSAVVWLSSLLQLIQLSSVDTDGLSLLIRLHSVHQFINLHSVLQLSAVGVLQNHPWHSLDGHSPESTRARDA